jgi:hypothetical protein
MLTFCVYQLWLTLMSKIWLETPVEYCCPIEFAFIRNHPIDLSHPPKSGSVAQQYLKVLYTSSNLKIPLLMLPGMLVQPS